jgi:hypothetical protein
MAEERVQRCLAADVVGYSNLTGDDTPSNQNSSTYKSTLQNVGRISQMKNHGITNWVYFRAFRKLNLVQVHWEL